MPGCGCGKSGGGSTSGSGSANAGPFQVQAPNGGVITSWRTEAEQQAAIERTGGRAI